MAIEARPVQLLQQRVQDATTQRTAYMALSALLVALKGAASAFDETSFFRTARAASSNTDVVTATAVGTASPGVYAFRVNSLAAASQLISGGMPDKDSTPVGAGTLTVELGRGALDPTTSLDVLNEGAGVHRGMIRITDRSGRSADIDLTAAITVNDVLRAINSRADISVKAAVRNDRIVLTDVSGGAGSFAVADLGGGRTASDLGIAASANDNEIVGSPVFRLGAGTALSVLNDGNGVRRNGILDDFAITTRSGESIAVNLSGRLRFTTRLEELNSGNGVRLGTIRLTNRAGRSGTVDLSGARTIQDVVNAINTAVDTDGASLQISASLVNASLTITDTSVAEGLRPASNLRIEDVSGYAARDLGIAADADAAIVSGTPVYRIRTVGDVLRAINYAAGNDGKVQAALSDDGARTMLNDTTAGTGQTQVQALNESKAAYDLGILDARTGQMTSQRVVAGLNTVLLKSLNGGAGVGLGTVEITAGDGTVTAIDLQGAETLQDLLDAINATTATSKVRAELSSSKLGIVIRDVSGGAGAMTIADILGTTASDLHIASSGSGLVGSGNLQLQYISEETPLSQLNGGRGVAYGKFKIVNSLNSERVVELSSDTDRTVGDVLKRINNLVGLNVVARINSTGDGILLEDRSGGSGTLKVLESGGTTAADLNIRKEAAAGQNTIDGSYEVRIAVGPNDTLQSVAARINDAAGPVAATLINDGSGSNPYRLSLLSKVSGTAGRLLVDGGATGLSFAPRVEARDAVVFFGGADSSAVMPIVSSTNTITKFIDGVTLNLTGTSSAPVTVTVARDADKVVESVKTFVKAFNDVVDRIKSLTKYDATTNTRGLLLGDGTISVVQNRLYGLLNATVAGADAGFTRLTSVGLYVGDGAKIELDENRLRKALTDNPASVEKLFTLQTKVGEKVQNVGLGYRIQQVLDDLTANQTGLLSRQEQQLADRVELFNDRIADMNALLAKKQQRLEAQFQAMEQSLAMLQQQQTALSGLVSINWLAGSSSSSNR